MICKNFFVLNNWLWKGPFYSHSKKVTNDEQIVLEEGGRAAKNFDQHLRRFQRDSLSSAAWKYSRRSEILNGHYYISILLLLLATTNIYYKYFSYFFYYLLLFFRKIKTSSSSPVTQQYGKVLWPSKQKKNFLRDNTKYM